MHTGFRRKRKLTAVLEDENNDENTHALKNARMVWLKIIIMTSPYVALPFAESRFGLGSRK